MPTSSSRSNRCLTLVIASVLFLIAGILLLALLTGGEIARASGPPSDVRSASNGANIVSPTPCAAAAFRQVSSPNPEEQNYFYGVSALSATDAWAVGLTWSGFGSYESFTAHWDGAQWTRVPSPNPDYDPVLRGVAALASNNVWAVGTVNGDALILHWDGTQWAQSPVPDFGTDYTFLYGVAAVDANNVWAVGKRTGSEYSTLVLHWDGVQWSEDLTGRILGHPGYPTFFRSVTINSANDIWAVGTIFAPGGLQTLTAHWNGTTWQRIASPNPTSSGDNVLFGVTATPSGTIWAVGYYYGNDVRNHTLVMRWTGSQWEIVPAPDPTVPEGPGGGEGTGRDRSGPEGEPVLPDGGGGGDPCQGGICDGNFLYGVDATADNEVWAVGSSDRFSFSRTNAFVLRWDGTQWSEVPSDSPSPQFYNRLYSVSAAAPGRVWAVGTYLQASPTNYLSLIEEYDASFCPSPTPAPPTSTPTPCTGTPEWVRVPSAGGPTTNRINSVAVVAPDDMWAVGEFGSAGDIMHWDGTAWTILPQVAQNIELNDITVISASDIWAVGTAGGQVTWAATVHWDGSEWTQVDIGTYVPGDRLYGVAGTASNNVWAVGKNDDGLLFLHWDGAQWQRGALNGRGLPKREAPDYSNDYLFDITASGPNEMWAVGTLYLSGQWRSLIMRWDPQNGWNFASSPSPGAYANFLRSVTAIAPNDVWAVGYYRDSYEAANETLTLHWNGAQWAVVPSPNPTVPGGLPGARNAANSPPSNAPTYDYDGHMLFGVDGVSSSEVWAVGYIAIGQETRTMTLRWNGTAWSSVSSPNYQTISQLTSVVALAHDYAWAVGREGPYWDIGNTLTLRYGPPCNATPLPTNTPVAATNTPRPPTNTPVVPTNTPLPPTATPFACGVTPLLQDGFEHAGTLGPNFRSEVATCEWIQGGCGWVVDADMHHSGAYSVHAPAIPDTSDQRLVSTTPVSLPTGALEATLSFWHVEEFVDLDGGVLEVSTDAGATWQDAGPNITEGGYNTTLGGPFNPLEGRPGWGDYTFGAWNRVTVNLLPYAGHSLLFQFRLGTNYSIGSPGWNIDDVVVTIRQACTTGTPTPIATGTAAATAIACTLSFSDMDPSNPFYSQAMCLACMGMVSGYSDGTFRPYNEITRGQLAKIVSNTAGFDNQIPQGQWSFTDVPYGSTFWMYVERLASGGVMAGYACGGPNEPCDGENRPYFRPGAGATRGQLTKIVSNAAGYSDVIPEAQHTFADVPPASTFRLYVERLLLNRPGVMSGYPCGGPGEPCDSENRPYFRPNNPLTRGQTSKIVANTFYPDCALR